MFCVRLAGCHCWLAQQCEPRTRPPLLDKPDSATQKNPRFLRAHPRAIFSPPTPRPKKQRASPTQITHNHSTLTKRKKPHAETQSFCSFFSVPLRETFLIERKLPNFCSSRVATQHKEQHQTKHERTKLPDFRTQPWGPPAISDKSHPKESVSQHPQQQTAKTFAQKNKGAAHKKRHPFFHPLPFTLHQSS